MASSYTGLGTELMTTGENAGTWGSTTNTNLQILEQISGGYTEQDIAGSADTTTLSVSDGSTGAVLGHRIIKFTGTITGNQIVTIPLDVQQMYVLVNGTSGAYTVQFKYASGSGSSVTFAATDKGTKLVYATADHATNPNLVDTGIASTGDHDLDGNELILDANGNTSITADTDDQIDIKIAGADDFQFTANTFTAQSGSSIVVPESGLTFGSTAITSTAAELNLLDGVSGLVQSDFTKLAAVDSTAAELNIVDGGTSATSTTVADADRVVLNDNGTMVQVAVTDLAAYFDDEITAMPNLTSVGTLSTLTVDNVIVNGTTIGHTDDTDLITLADGVATVAGEISVTTLDIGGTNVTATAAEINLIDGGTARGTTAVADGDGLLVNDAGTMRMTNVTTLKTYFQSGAGVAADDISVGDGAVTLSTSSGNITIDATANDTDIIFKGTDNSSDITMLTLDGSDAGSATFNHDIILGNDSFVRFGDAGEKITGDGTDLTINSSADLHLTATTDINIPANVGLTFGDDAEKIEGDGTNLTISGNDLILDAANEIILDSAANAIRFKDAGTDIGSFFNVSSDFVIQSRVQDKDIILKGDDGGSVITALTLDMSDAGTATFNHDIILGNDSFVQFGDSAEKISGDGTDLTITGNNINLTATADVVIPANVGITFGSGEKIEGDSTDLTVTSGAKINLTATSDIHIPNNVGIVFGGDSEKIEGDGTDLTISANNLTVDAAADINLDADGADVNIKDGGTTILSFTNSSSDAVLTAGVQDKDIIFKGDDGGSAVTSLTLDMSNSGAAIFSAAAYNAEATLTDGATPSWNAITQPVAKITIAGNRTIGAASGGVAGAFISLLIIQDGTGSRTMTWNAAYEFASDTAPTLTTTANLGDLFVFRYNGSKWLEVGRNLALTLS